ncbi:hypothetical protein [Flavobacterium sp. GT3R68]|uniref:hypothetical protein n=1 Tax=Flavobacterium sp. GT3R68 TaxID=2594437 RepID=UPI000F88DE65|nr:hypothetical protein [Flavobacterium sp. GT3R68]RTY85592.1 hypothetical protein EKL32_28485 [Flavobacterium sp. GSN2]TRW89333.1 hypothetical protein FNW07_13555 [Flavobacterium sp. GT3R68]
MKNFILFIIPFITIISCDKIPGISDYVGVPPSSEISKEQGLLIAKYTASQNEVFIDGEKYIITDSWATYRFKTKNSKVINKDIYDFLFSVKCIRTGKLLTEQNPTLFLNKNVCLIGENYGYGIGIGIQGSLLSIDFLSNRKPISPENIIVEFQSGNKKQRVNFVKENKASH